MIIDDPDPYACPARVGRPGLVCVHRFFPEVYANAPADVALAQHRSICRRLAGCLSPFNRNSLFARPKP